MNQKLFAFFRVRALLNREKAKILLTSIVMPNSSYCPLIWMFNGKTGKKQINGTNNRALRVLYEEYDSSFEHLFEKDRIIIVHQKNLQNPITQMYKRTNQINP